MRGVFAIFILTILILSFTAMVFTGLYALGVIGPDR